MKTLLETAMGLYNSAKNDWGPYLRKYGSSSVDGTTDTDGNGRLDIDCSHLVHNALRAAGYTIPYMSSAVLNSIEAQAYFEELPVEEASSREDDIIVYAGHVGVFGSYDPATSSGTFFGSQSAGPSRAMFTAGESDKRHWGTDFKVLRPKKSLKTGIVERPKSRVLQSTRWADPVDTPGMRRWGPHRDDAINHRRWGDIGIIPYEYEPRR